MAKALYLTVNNNCRLEADSKNNDDVNVLLYMGNFPPTLHKRG